MDLDERPRGHHCELMGIELRPWLDAAGGLSFTERGGSVTGVDLPPGAVEVMRGGGEMGALMRSTNWGDTRLGPPETWPQSLRTAVGLLLESRFPMYLAWGSDFVQFYNADLHLAPPDLHLARKRGEVNQKRPEPSDRVSSLFRGVASDARVRAAW